MKAKSQIQQQRESYSQNGSLILKKAAITEYDYNNTQFLAGCYFLQELYPEDEYGFYYRKFAYTQSFWKWWYSQWKKFEAEFIGYLYENKTIPTKPEWQYYMYQMIHDREIESEYYNQYLKLIYNGEL